ncbi:MAG TPA: hydroxymethylbilane synthase [candidate division Zixibacteria bacterium]|nr:hydroxymethylbilane synthase [candidate division Zixibacteria bacterium]
MDAIRIGTRGSKLALAQAQWVQGRIQARYPGTSVSLVVIRTSGDRFSEASIAALGGKGLFVKEIEEALLRGEIDIAVHSMKDLPAELPPGLTLAAVPEREDPRDVLISRNGEGLYRLKKGAVVGTGSLRRQAQLLCSRPDLTIVSMRGNIDTRLKKLDSGTVDALLLAAAGLKRLGWEGRITEYLEPEVCLSAPCQGALAIETRAGDATCDKLGFLHDPCSGYEVAAERGFLQRFGGGCRVPLGARAFVEGAELRVAGIVAAPDGSRACRGRSAGPIERASELGRELAERLLSEGAASIIAAATAPG